MIRTLLIAIMLSQSAGVACDEVVHQVLNEDFLAALRKNVQESNPESTHFGDDTLALAIEWIRMREEVTEGRIGKNANTFLGFVAGRIGVRPPDWWSNEVRRGIKDVDGTVGYFNVHSRHFSKMWKGDKTGWQFSGVDNVVASADGLVVTQGATTITLMKSDFCDLDTSPKWDAREDGAVAAAIRDNICIVAFQCVTEIPDTPTLIYCVNMKTRKLIWKQALRRGVLPVMSIGGATTGTYTQITIDGERVAVWTGNGFTMAVEAFDVKNGKQIAIFSSFYLNGLHVASPVNDKAVKN